MLVISIIILSLIFYTATTDSYDGINIVFNILDWIGYIFATLLFIEAVYLYNISNKSDKSKWWMKKITAIAGGFCFANFIGIIGAIIIGLIKWIIQWFGNNLFYILIFVLICLVIYLYFMLNKQLYKWLKK